MPIHLGWKDKLLGVKVTLTGKAAGSRLSEVQSFMLNEKEKKRVRKYNTFDKYQDAITKIQHRIPAEELKHFEVNGGVWSSVSYWLLSSDPFKEVYLIFDDVPGCQQDANQFPQCDLKRVELVLSEAYGEKNKIEMLRGGRKVVKSAIIWHK